MIHDRLESIHKYSKSFPFLVAINEFIKTEDSKPKPFDFIRKDIDQQVYVVRYEFETAIVNSKNIELESHRLYADVHVSLNTSEKILYSSTELEQVRPYVLEDDVEFFVTKALSESISSPNEFILLLPYEAHRPGSAVSAPEKLSKLVFKIKSP